MGIKLRRYNYIWKDIFIFYKYFIKYTGYFIKITIIFPFLFLLKWEMKSRFTTVLNQFWHSNRLKTKRWLRI